MTLNKGALAALGAYFLWGFLPVYWKMIQSVPAGEILAHRMVWSFVFTVVLLGSLRHWRWLRTAVTQPLTLLIFLGSAMLLAINWLTYIWAVNAGYIVDTSLGYFINPLVNVLLGVLFLKERLRPGQLLAVTIATLGVSYLTLSYGVVLWIALTLAFSFGFYGLLRKTAPLGALEGFSLETILLALPAFAYLLYTEASGAGSFFGGSSTTMLLLAFTGVVTAVPLLLFAYGAKRITLTTLGILQYLAPTLQFLIGVLVYGEAFTTTRLIGFSIIWLALLIYSAEGIVQARRRRLVASATTG